MSPFREGGPPPQFQQKIDVTPAPDADGHDIEQKEADSGVNAVESERKSLGVAVGPAERRLVREGAKELTYILPVTEAVERVLAIQDSIPLPEGLLRRKKEFHVTALGFGARERIRAAIEAGQRENRDVAGAIDRMLSETDFSFELDPSSAKLVHNLDYDPEAVRGQTGRAAFESEYTVVVDVRMPGMERFYDRMREELGIDLGEPASHITLYVKDNEAATGLGIAITNFEAQSEGRAFPRIESRPIELQEPVQ